MMDTPGIQYVVVTDIRMSFGSIRMLPFLFLLFSSCVGVTDVIPGAQPVSPLAPLQMASKGAVWVENFCEDEQEDRMTITSLEAAADLLALPVTMVTWTARLAAYGTVGIAMAYSGVPANEAVDRINEWLPWGWSGPNPDTVDYRGVRHVEGCSADE